MISTLLSLFLPLVSAETSTPNTGDQIQSFLFGFTTNQLVLPITSSCPSPLTLTPLTPTNAHTSDPKAPYTMVTLVHEQLIDDKGKQFERLYSASLDVGDMNELRQISHPWMNGTQFIACIWGSNGASGGCQDLVTVVPSDDTASAYTSPNSTCRRPDVLESWVPPRNETLDVEVLGISGEVSWNAWPIACSDLQINPKNGTPPFTLLVAPAAHPPVNITTSTLPINYTIRLTHGQAFMLGLYDSSGNSWAFGPLHSGESDDLSCLAVATGQQAAKKNAEFGVGVLAGSISGAFIIGAIGATILMWFLLSGKRKIRKTESQINLYSDPRPASFKTPSGSFMSKHATPGDSVSPYLDSPATLYDPYMAAPNPQHYPQPPGPALPRDSTGSISSRDRVFPRPPITGAGYSDHHANPYENHDSQGDIRDQRERGTSIHSQHHQQQPSSPGLGHVQDPSWISSNSSRREASFPSDQLPQNPSSPRPGSLGSQHQHRTAPQGEEPSSPSSPSSTRGPRNVYVVHADGGNGDLHIQLPDSNSRVIELPPNYRPSPNNNNNNNNNVRRPPRSPNRQATSNEQNNNFNMSTVANVNEVTEEELRARAEARMREKLRGLS
ncbi:uncharacterized protein L201_001770 [Kwoniella dendrophila CBS 6074]|uniref:Uncharacterized protein n=1 Tax=Kwoniella dendrophila CBS 6074 TaxID=1295534 RepID=A0AAX4JNA5_9TREE